MTTPLQELPPPFRMPLALALEAPDPLAELIEEPTPGVFVFDAFTPAYCKHLLAELDQFGDVQPNSMNKYGRVLEDIGYQPFCDSLLDTLVNPLVRRVYPGMGRMKDVYGFTITYSRKQRNLDQHYDSSDATLNICLGRDWSGGRLVFLDDDGRIEAKLNQRVGRAVLHPGSYMHKAQNVTRGERCNLILWCQA